MSRRDEALAYHEGERPGKIEVVPSKPISTQYDLSLAYSPGVAEPCRAIQADPDAAFAYTARGNLVAVATNGTAVLGLGAIGPVASKPVMEGKAVLFKKFAGIDVFDLEIDAEEPEAFVETVARLAPTFGGINLEDIKAPECFYIEEELKKRIDIPVMHDDQHGTAIISAAGLLNGLEVVGKRIEELTIVVIGAGAAAVASARYYCTLGVRRENIVMIDADGVIDREHPGTLRAEEKGLWSFPAAEFATGRRLGGISEALRGADMLLGLSVGGIITGEQLALMAKKPLVFTLANPEPEISYDEAKAARPDAVIATGRSDHPNQINNVLGFPYIFRGALDAGARQINEEMKIAATHAIARLAREPVPQTVNRAYEQHSFEFGPEYLIPKPLDPRLITAVAPAVARAAIESGVARRSITDWPNYEAQILERVGSGQKMITSIINQARKEPKRIIFAEADDYEVLKAAQIVREQGIAEPILLGQDGRIDELVEKNEIRGLEGCRIIDPAKEEDLCRRYAEYLYQRRQRRGVTYKDAVRLMGDRNFFGAAMLAAGEGDGLVSGRTKEYPKIVRPALQIIGTEPGVGRVAGMYMVQTRRGLYFFADTTVNLAPTADELVEIIGLTARVVRYYGVEPVLAVLSHSNFGSTESEESVRCAEAVAKAKEAYPKLVLDGEMQANVALDPELLRENYPFSRLVGERVNTLIFPNLSAGNIAYKLIGEAGGGELVGPILMGMAKPVHVLQLGTTAREIVNMVAITVVDAQRQERVRGE